MPQQYFAVLPRCESRSGSRASSTVAEVVDRSQRAAWVRHEVDSERPSGDIRVPWSDGNAPAVFAVMALQVSYMLTRLCKCATGLGKLPEGANPPYPNSPTTGELFCII